MIIEKIDEYLKSKEKKELIKEDIDSLDLTDDIITLINSLDDSVLDDRQIALKNKILSSINDEIIDDDLDDDEVIDDSPDFPADAGMNVDPYTDDFDEIEDPGSEEPEELPADKYYEDKTEWIKSLSEGKKPSGKKKNKSNSSSKNINNNKKKK
ncbi:MAG TPA: hypothetical protein P5140_08335 [Methanofastidiosum sp.]|nr:hypothetical protein [Methanofastidiosum sp.]